MAIFGKKRRRKPLRRNSGFKKDKEGFVDLTNSNEKDFDKLGDSGSLPLNQEKHTSAYADLSQEKSQNHYNNFNTNRASSNSQRTSDAMGFLGGIASSNSETKNKRANTEYNPDGYVQASDSNTLGMAERRRRLAKRMKNMTDRLEEISNQLYHLQQRMDILEKKMNM